jgi:hypothetical protein
MSGFSYIYSSKERTNMSMTFQEKSQWVTLLGLLVAFGGYFKSAWQTLLPTPVAPDILPDQASLFLAATILLVVILVTGHIVIAIFDHRTDTDERDRLIELKGERYGSLVLACGVFVTLCTAVYIQGNAIMAHVLLGSWVLAGVVESLTQILMYRRSA